MNILDQLAEHARQRVEAAKQTVPLAEAKRQALALPKGDFRFEKAPAKPGLAFSGFSRFANMASNRRTSSGKRLRILLSWLRLI